jgi:hypothetical protein
MVLGAPLRSKQGREIATAISMGRKEHGAWSFLNPSLRSNTGDPPSLKLWRTKTKLLSQFRGARGAWSDVVNCE